MTTSLCNTSVMANETTAIVAQQYDFVIAGAGCAGLSLLLRLIQAQKFSDKKILLIDKAPKQINDRTWCFWDKEENFFEKIVYKKWDKIIFSGINFYKEFAITPYKYKMIRGIDFYEYCFSIIAKQPNITIQYGVINAIKSNANDAFLEIDNQIIKAKYIFNSIQFKQVPLKEKQYSLLQHFKGWVIETTTPAFNPNIATLMDFNINQQYGTAFVYVMPFTETKALIEYTFFTKELVQQEVYENGLKNYIQQFLKGKAYKIIEEEYGIIPMTNYSFSARNGNIINIGTIGGQTKASSGYTFQFIQKRTNAIVENMLATGIPFTKKGLTPKRFVFYDTVLLRILYNNILDGDLIFTTLFQKNTAISIFKFLDNETSFIEDLFIIKSLPTFPFAKSALSQLIG